MRNFDPTFEPKGMVGVRRLEVITGVGGRRAWSHEDKGRIVAESFSVVMTDGIIGCPHQEGIDYQGEWCPVCEFWRERDRFAGQMLH